MACICTIMVASQDPLECAKAAYDQFDLAGIFILHSRIPGLLDVFVAEYQDSIIACWEQGVWFLRDRALEMQAEGIAPSLRGVRREVYHCFSVLYVMAKHRQAAEPTSYPHYSWIDRARLFIPRARIVRDAQKEREKIISEALDASERPPCR